MQSRLRAVYDGGGHEVLVWALWPSQREQFDEAARVPLRED